MKLNKIKVVLFAAGIFTALPAFALDDVVHQSTVGGLLGTAYNSYSTAIGDDAKAGSGQAYGTTSATGATTVTYGTLSENSSNNTNTKNVAIGQGAEAGAGSDSEKSYGSEALVDDANEIAPGDSGYIETWDNGRHLVADPNGVAPGGSGYIRTFSDANKYKESEHGGVLTTSSSSSAFNGTANKNGHGSSVAIGADAYADWGGTAIGTEATASGRDSVGIGKEVMVTGHKAVGIGEDTFALGFRSTAVGNSSHATELWSTALGAEAHATEQDALAVGRDAQASAEAAVAVGNSSRASGDESIAIGYHSVVSGDSSVAIGPDAEAEGDNSVALGAGSVASRNNTVSVGDSGAERTISNVAPGVYGTDAVNVNQLKAVERKISAGVSAAMAMTTPVIAAGKSNAVALGAASYNNTSAIALNLAHKFTDDVVATASVSKGFNAGRTSSGSNDDIGIKGSVSWSF
jgi:hypothetical protein